MVDPVGHCSCCGAPLEPLSIAVSLQTNSVSVGWSPLTVRLSPTEAELLYVLAQASPITVAYDRLIVALWGVNEGSSAYSHMKVVTDHTRKKIAPLDLTIETVRFHGYRLVRSDQTIFQLAARARGAVHAK